MKLHENSTEPEKVILVSLDTGEYDTEMSLYELSELTRTAGAEVFATLQQTKEKPDSGTYIGSGRLSELAEICKNNEISLIIVDDELTPSQQKNIEKATDTRVIDRTTLILDIFALNARTSEGKLQVELAQLRYMLPRLSGLGTAMSRLGGGIGTRGPGESKLESDKRHIRRRIHSLEEDFKSLEKRRSLHRERRKKDGVITVAIVGYTNAGKSTLLNALTDAGVLAEDKLFATLDPTSRALKLPDGRSIMLIDTVGFISRLPHKLVEAFKSTLEEVADADLILNICDASDNNFPEHISVTEELIKELGAEGTPIINVLNKCDIAQDVFALDENKTTVKISAKTGAGLDRLMELISDNLPGKRIGLSLLIPFDRGSLAAKIRSDCDIEEEEYRPDGLYLKARIDERMLKTVEEFIV